MPPSTYTHPEERSGGARLEGRTVDMPRQTEAGDLPAAAVAEAVARHSYGKLVAFLAHRTKNVAAAEDALSDAFAAALKDWPARGVPRNPEAWLMAVARRKAVDADRRQRGSERAAPHLGLIADE